MYSLENYDKVINKLLKNQALKSFIWPKGLKEIILI